MFGSASKVNTARLIDRDGWMCSYCGRFLTLDMMTVDHIVPTLRGGPDTLANTVISCRACNAQKSDMLLEEYIHWLGVRHYVFEIAPNESIAPEAVDLIVGKHQTHTVIALPALWAGLHLLDDELRAIWQDQGAIIVRMVKSRLITDVAILSGVLFDYYSMKKRERI